MREILTKFWTPLLFGLILGAPLVTQADDGLPPIDSILGTGPEETSGDPIMDSFLDSYLDSILTDSGSSSTSYDPFSSSSMAEGDGGGWVGAGGDINLTTNNVWFLGTESISYCIARSSSFAFSQSQLEGLVKNSIRDWQNFLNKYGISQRNLTLRQNRIRPPLARRNPNRAPKIDLANSSRPLRMSTRFYYQGKCNTSHVDPGKTLKVYFGHSNDIIKGHQKFSAEYALGLAVRPKYDHKSYRNGGYIWIANFTQDYNRLKHLFLHELGHVFGMKHDSVFVMSENVAIELTSTDKLGSKYFGSIESPGWVYKMNPGSQVTLTSFRGFKAVRGPLARRGNGRRVGPGRRGRGGRGRPIGPRRPHRPGHQPIICRDDYQRNGLLPGFLVKFPGCHKITLSELPNRNPRRPNQKVFSLEISYQDHDKVQKIRGKFFPVKPKATIQNGPGVFTLWKRAFNGKIQTFGAKGVFDQSMPSLPSRGYFEFSPRRNAGKTIKYPARITNDRGVSLEIFLNKAGGKWWTLNSVHKNPIRLRFDVETEED